MDYFLWVMLQIIQFQALAEFVAKMTFSLYLN